MFLGCLNLSDIKPLENWNVSNGKYFEFMFNKCSLLKDLTAVEKWNVSKDKIELIKKNN